MGACIDIEMRCVHCRTTETPLWRAGPAGPKTLCNACGVRWKKTGSVIPRSKRSAPSASVSSIKKENHQQSNDHVIDSNLNDGSNSPRKRIRTSTPERSQPPKLPLPTTQTTTYAAPRPVSVFRVSDASRSKYESVFSGLMVVHRGIESSSSTSNDQNSNTRSRTRSRTQTAKGSAFFTDIKNETNDTNELNQEDLLPCPSPPPVERSDEQNSVYVTEVHAPSPSPSPPPMPRVERVSKDGRFRLLLAAVADERKPGI